MEYLIERICDCVTPLSGTTSAYRSYLRVLAELLLTPSLDTLAHSAATHSLLRDLLVKADTAASRQAALDVEFLYALFKTINRLGIQSKEDHKYIQQLRDTITRIYQRFINSKRPYNKAHRLDPESIKGLSSVISFNTGQA